MAAEYFLRRGQTVRGPTTARKIRELAAGAKLQKTDEIRRGEEGEWFRVESIDGLYGAEAVISDDELIVDPLAKLAGETAGKVAGAAKASGAMILGAAKGLLAKAKENRERIILDAAAMERQSWVSKLTAEKQDPQIVGEVLERVSAILMTGEEIMYIAVQQKPLLNLKPDCVVLTTQRLILYRPKLLGRVSFDDHIWRNLADARLEENIIGSTLSFAIAGGQRLSMDYLPKDQARILYRFAQEQESHAEETRRQRRMEEDRARAGNINVQTNVTAPAAAAAPAAADPMAILKQLKGMLDAGLISSEEFEAKKRDILSRM